MVHVKTAVQNRATEWTFRAAKRHADPFGQVDFDVVFAGCGGEWRVPGFWAGGRKWKCRFAPPRAGEYRFKTACSVDSDTGLHGQTGEFRAEPYAGDNPLYLHGRVRPAGNRRHFEHADGTPFFWLGDTWWMGLCDRLRWKGEFARLAADRTGKGFTVIQIVAGLYPDMPWMDQRGANEAGFPYDRNFTTVNPRYFDKADRRIALIVESGMVPCIVGCWGYYLTWMGTETMKRHWRHLVARWGAQPVVWCLAGEGVMPYYLSETRQADTDAQRCGWTEVARYVRCIDPYGTCVGIHPTDRGRDQVTDETVLDFDMLQTGHGGYDSLPNTVEQVRRAYARQPAMPVVVGEVNYEGILGASKDDVQRLAFWTSLLNGAAGFTYGANGIWQVNRPDKPFGASPHGSSWGDRPWQGAMHLPGSSLVGLGRGILQRYPWWRLEPHPEWIEPNARKDWRLMHAAGVPGEVRIILFCQPKAPWSQPEWGTVRDIEPGLTYHARWVNPEDGAEFPIGPVKPAADGSWQAPQMPVLTGMLLILERQ